MNTIRSTWIGWGTLTVAGAGAYYFAKQSIDADKRERFEAQQRRRQLASSLETQSMYSSPPKKKATQKKEDPVGNPSSETPDAAPSEQNRPKEKSKYEPKEVYRTRKGDRFS